MQDRLTKLEEVILAYYLSLGYVVGVGKWEFLVSIKAQYRNKRLDVTLYDENLGGYVGIVFTVARKTTQEMYDEAIEYFSSKEGKRIEVKEIPIMLDIESDGREL
jgi:hypothetical protein